MSAEAFSEKAFGPGDAMTGLHDEAGAVWTVLDGVRTPRHYGDPTREYEAAVGSGALFDRSHRAFVPVEGRAPAQMLTGIVSGRMPAELVGAGEGIVRGEAEPSTVLTPKGKLVTELRIFRLEAGPGGAHLLELPRAGLDGLLDHMKTYLPPRMARQRGIGGGVDQF